MENPIFLTVFLSNNSDQIFFYLCVASIFIDDKPIQILGYKLLEPMRTTTELMANLFMYRRPRRWELMESLYKRKCFSFFYVSRLIEDVFSVHFRAVDSPEAVFRRKQTIGNICSRKTTKLSVLWDGFCIIEELCTERFSFDEDNGGFLIQSSSSLISENSWNPPSSENYYIVKDVLKIVCSITFQGFMEL